MPKGRGQVAWRDYRTQCEARNAFSRFALEALADMLGDARQRARLTRVMQSGRPLPKPADHLGGPETDFFLLQFSRPEVAELLAGLNPEASGLSPGKARHLVICWREYLDSFAGNTASSS